MIAAAVGDVDTDDDGDAETPLESAIFLRLQERGCSRPSPSPPQSDGGGGFHARVSRQAPSAQTPPLVALVALVPLVVAASAGARGQNDEEEEEEDAEVGSAPGWGDDDDAVEGKLELLEGLPLLPLFVVVVLSPPLGWVEVATSPVSSPPGPAAAVLTEEEEPSLLSSPSLLLLVPQVCWGGRDEEGGGGVLGAPSLASLPSLLLLLLPFSFRAFESQEDSLPLWNFIACVGVHILLDSGEDMGDGLLVRRLGEDDGEREGERSCSSPSP